MWALLLGWMLYSDQVPCCCHSSHFPSQVSHFSLMTEMWPLLDGFMWHVGDKPLVFIFFTSFSHLLNCFFSCHFNNI